MKKKRNYKRYRKPHRSHLGRNIFIFLCLFLVASLIVIFQKPKEKEVDTFSKSVVQADPSLIPEFAGDDYVFLDDNLPEFTQYDLENVMGEHFTPLDKQGRCGTAMAMLHRSMMPTEKRGNIGKIHPTGWIQKKYENIVRSNPPYLYNRCHLIAYGLTGQNANEQNLITGTRYLNAEIMLPWEEMVMKYLDHSNNHVLYRVSPYFQGNELLARGIEMEAYSVEDQGEGICYHVFLYNYQPGVVIDYKDGDNWLE